MSRMVQTKARACDGKIAYPTWERAESRRQRYIAGGAADSSLAVYPCPHGAHYHIGHASRRTRRSR